MRVCKAFDEESVRSDLVAHGIKPTSQRIQIARVLYRECAHLSADEVFSLVNRESDHSPERQKASKATVYNTLGLFAKKGVVREVIADPARVFYDPNTEPHHHLFNVTTGELVDVDAGELEVGGLPDLPEGTELEGVEVVIRLRQAR